MYSFSSLRVLTVVFLMVYSVVGLGQIQESPENTALKKQCDSLSGDAYSACAAKVHQTFNSNSDCSQFRNDFNDAFSKCSTNCISTLNQCTQGTTSSTPFMQSAITLIGLLGNQQNAPLVTTPSGAQRTCVSQLGNVSSIKSDKSTAMNNLQQAEKAVGDDQEKLLDMRSQYQTTIQSLTRQIADSQITCKQLRYTSNDKENEAAVTIQNQEFEGAKALQQAQNERNNLQLQFSNAYRDVKLKLQAQSESSIKVKCLADTAKFAKENFGTKKVEAGNLTDMSSAATTKSDAIKKHAEECVTQARAAREAQAEAAQEQLDELQRQINVLDANISKQQQILTSTQNALKQKLQNLKSQNALLDNKCSNQTTDYINTYNQKINEFPQKQQLAQSNLQKDEQMQVIAQTEYNQAQQDYNLARSAGLDDNTSGRDMLANYNKVRSSLSNAGFDDNCNAEKVTCDWAKNLGSTCQSFFPKAKAGLSGKTSSVGDGG